MRYALVAYIKGPITAFVENLRRELHPALPHHAAHLTFLPPRQLQGTESEALHTLEQICGSVEPFEVTLGEMESFVPTTCTVYIGVAQGASRMHELHRQLNQQALEFAEEWPYVPHLTIAKMNDLGEASRRQDCPPVLEHLQRKPAHSGRPAYVCPRRLSRLLGRFGAGPARRQPGFALTRAVDRNFLRVTFPLRYSMPELHGLWYISLPCVALRQCALYTKSRSIESRAA